MIVRLLDAAEFDLAEAFDYYELARVGLGRTFVDAFRRAADQILEYPRGWRPLDNVYRQCRLRRFPYGIIYRVDEAAGQIVIVAVMQLNRRPDTWRRRDESGS